jgi:peptidoglycan-N-acetylglucosamine deacetylase
MRLALATCLMLAAGVAVSAPVPENHRDTYVFHGRRSSNLVTLTFDDGPHAERTPRLMQILEDLHCPATFFVLGESCQANPGTLAALISSDFEIGNHSMTHRNLREAGEDRIHSEIDGLEDVLAAAGAGHSHLFRPPYGNANRRVVEHAFGELGMDICMWSIDTNDWRQGTTSEEIIDQITEHAQGGDIILMHDIHTKAVEVVPVIVPRLRERGLEFVTLGDLIADMHAHPEDTGDEAHDEVSDQSEPSSGESAAAASPEAAQIPPEPATGMTASERRRQRTDRYGYPEGANWPARGSSEEASITAR